MASYGAKLSLIAHDNFAMWVLAAWACADIPLADVETDATVERIAELAGLSATVARGCLRRVAATGCLLDGDISDLADRLLQQRVLSASKRGKK